MLALYPLLVLFVLAITTRRIVVSLSGGLVVASAIAGWDNGSGPLQILVERAGEILLSQETLLCFIFILTLGILSHLVTDSGAASAFSQHIIAKNKAHSGRFLELLLWGLSIPLAIDDYLSTIARGGLARSFSREANIAKTRLAYQVHSTSFSLHVLMPLSSTVVVVLALLQAETSGRAIAGVASPFWFYFQTIPYNAYSVIAAALSLALILRRPGRETHEHKEEERDETNFKPYDILVPLLILPILTVALFLLPWFLNQSNLSELAAAGQILPCLLPSSLISILIFSLLVIRRGRAPCDLVVWGREGVRTIAPVCLVLTLGWTLGVILSKDLKTGEAVSELLSLLPGERILLPALIFLISGSVTAILGCPWTALGVLIPIVLHIIESLGAESGQAALWVAALLSGVNLGEQASPLSDLSILTARTVGISPFSHSVSQLPLIVMGGGAALVVFLLLGMGESPSLAILSGVLLVLQLHRLSSSTFSSSNS